MLIKRISLLVITMFIGFATSPIYGGDMISCDSFESCPEADTSALEARIAALEALLAGATRGVDPGNSQDTLTFGNSITSEGVKIPELSTTGREGASLVCFNGAGELLPCADGVEPPPPGDPYLGSWTGRMVYDRRSTGTCHDADVFMTVISGSTCCDRITSTTVIRDSGGLDTDSSDEELNLESGLAAGKLFVFYSDIQSLIVFTLQFDTQGSAQGFWNYENNNCYGTWNFTKD